MLVAKYDHRSFRTECAFYGIDGQLCINNNGYARHLFHYDERGFCVKEEFLDTEGSPCLDCAMGVAAKLTEYNESGQVIKVTFLNTKGEVDYNKEGMAITIYDYNVMGRMTQQSAYDPSGNPCSTIMGVHKTSFGYDNQGRCVNRAFFGNRGEPVQPNGFHRIETFFDEKGREVGTRFYDKQGNQIADQVHTAIVSSCVSNAAKEKIPEQSIVLRWNQWVIGSPYELLGAEMQKSRTKQKDIDLLTPDGEVIHVHFDEGLIGVIVSPYLFPKAESQKLKDSLPCNR